MEFKRRFAKTLAPIIIMVVANLAYIYHENILSKEEAEKEFKAADEIFIVEAAVRWEIEKHLQAIRESQGTICISTIRGFGQDKGFLNRLSDFKVLIKHEDGCLSDFKTGVRDRETNNKGVMISVSEIRWEKRDSVVVSTGYHEGNLSASGQKVFLVFRDKKWVVVGEALEWISNIDIPNRRC